LWRRKQVPLRLEPSRPRGHSKDVSLNQLRIAYFTRWGHDHGTPTPAIQEAVEEAATALARRGASVKQDRPSFFDQIDDVLDSWLLERSPADVYRKEMEKLTDVLPAGTVRVAASPDGLPIGLNLVGRAVREDIVLRVLAELESASGGWQPPDL